MSGLDPDVIKHALATARNGGMRHVRLKSGENRFSAVLSEFHDIPVDSAPSAEVGSAVVVGGPKSACVESSAVGYLRYAGEGIVVGSKIDSGQTVAEVVALGIANEVTARCSGTVTEVVEAEGAAVEFGQVILVLETE